MGLQLSRLHERWDNGALQQGASETVQEKRGYLLRNQDSYRLPVMSVTLTAACTRRVL